jgi:predicted  nucleic acid-binding Zn-ribbon protein
MLSMKPVLIAAVLVLARCPAAMGDEQPSSPAGNIKMLVQLIQSLALSIENDGKTELASYDKYACWCEDTLARKAKDISDAKALIDELQTEIEKLQGEVAAHASEIAHLEKLIAENKESQREATEVRANENADFEKEKTESEQCIGALEAAINVLAGAGTGKKKGFLETLQQARALSVVDGVREVLKRASYSARVSEKDLDFAREFFGKTGQFMVQHAGVSAAQTDAALPSHNPFGDYAPQSDRIVGILKGLYDTFTQSLEKSNVEEADAQKAFEEFMDTKRAELKTLEDTKEQQDLSKAQKEKKMAESKLLRADTQAQLKADQEFFATTQEGCKDKAKEWSERVRMRTQELQGINKAVEILSSPGALETFANSSSIALLQLTTQIKAVAPHGALSRKVSPEHFAALQGLARKFHSRSLDRIVAQARAGGYFDKVIASVDSMIALLRKEEAMDIAHRDRCQGAENKNTNDLEDLDTSIDKASNSIEAMQHTEKTLQQEISDLEIAIGDTEKDMSDRLAMRNQERKTHIKSLKDDQNALVLVGKAVDALTAFYERNKISMALIAKEEPEKEYTVDADKAPETVWDAGGAAYKGRRSENEGVVAIMKMIMEDIKHEMENARADDEQNQNEYLKENAAMTKTRDAQLNTKTATEKALAELQAKIEDTQVYHDSKQADKSSEEELKNAIYSDCSWVSTHFDSRAAARKKEMDGLQAAKGYLAGVADGSELAP